LLGTQGKTKSKAGSLENQGVKTFDWVEFKISLHSEGNSKAIFEENM
jgi:hypothetical protein